MRSKLRGLSTLDGTRQGLGVFCFFCFGSFFLPGRFVFGLSFLDGSFYVFIFF